MAPAAEVRGLLWVFGFATTIGSTIHADQRQACRSAPKAAVLFREVADPPQGKMSFTTLNTSLRA